MTAAQAAENHGDEFTFTMRNIYLHSNQNPLKKFTNSSRSTKFKDILPRNISQIIFFLSSLPPLSGCFHCFAFQAKKDNHNLKKKKRENQLENKFKNASCTCQLHLDKRSTK